MPHSPKIASVTCTAYRLPLSEPWISAKYRITHHELVLTEITLDNGVTGTGWCTTIGVGATSIASLVTSYLAPMIEGQDPRNHERLWEMLWQDIHFAGPAGVSTLAIATIDIALWDLKGKLTGLPLWQLLGGMRDTVEVYASAVNLHLDRDALLAQVEGQLGAGYNVFKLKIGRNDFEDDLGRLRAVRALIGPSRTLMVDVNQRWRAGEAVTRCLAMAEVRPSWIEEPILSDDVEGHAHVRRAGGLPVAIGEQLSNRFEFWNYVRAGAADILQPNVWKVGGITEWMKVAHLAQHANLAIAPHNALELSAHLVAAVSNGFMVENIFGGNLSDLGVVSEPVEITDATITMGRKPGHGIEFDRERLPAFAIEGTGPIRREPANHAGL